MPKRKAAVADAEPVEQTPIDARVAALEARVTVLEGLRYNKRELDRMREQPITVEHQVDDAGHE